VGSDSLRSISAGECCGDHSGRPESYGDRADRMMRRMETAGQCMSRARQKRRMNAA